MNQFFLSFNIHCQLFPNITRAILYKDVKNNILNQSKKYLKDAYFYLETFNLKW